MDLLINLNTAVEYIEKHLDNDLDYGGLAKISCLPEHQFKRMFFLVAGVSISEYVRRRRLTLAVFDLKKGKKVIDVAVKYGYQSSDSFSRAFRALHGVTPSKVKSREVPLKTFPRMSFQISIKGDDAMDYRFVEKEAFTVVGKKETVAYNGSEFNPAIWEHLEEIEHELKPFDNTAFSGVLHMSLTKGTGEVDYYIAVSTTSPCSPTFEQINIPANIWAVFIAEGEMPKALLNTWEKVYTDWFPSSGYELAEVPEIVKPIDETKLEIWIPVKGKN
ncbi:AraC family transcriptional regulator [Alkalihalobacillus sp. 1P02AB]|uniref:AraC family transcriptional regulator n=1 Tax=Alkalihalobacillus sp. 1P02AB TaxID=3132260 RepID=UPI0039A75F5B